MSRARHPKRPCIVSVFDGHPFMQVADAFTKHGFDTLAMPEGYFRIVGVHRVPARDCHYSRDGDVVHIGLDCRRGSRLDLSQMLKADVDAWPPLATVVWPGRRGEQLWPDAMWQRMEQGR